MLIKTLMLNLILIKITHLIKIIINHNNISLILKTVKVTINQHSKVVNNNNNNKNPIHNLIILFLW
jgi:hypothetical protein